MSSQNSKYSKFCDSLTSSGRMCCNYHIKGEKWCYKHKPKYSTKILCHGLPAVQKMSIVFSDNNVSECNCKWKNKYGEFSCKEEKKQYKFCDEHYEKFNKFKNVVNKCLNLLTLYQINRGRVDSYMKLFFQFYNFIIKYKEILVNCSMDKFSHISINKVNDFINTFSTGFVNINLVMCKNSVPCEIHIQNLLKLKEKIKSILVEDQIKKARNEIVSNSIKIFKLSEIYVKESENSNKMYSVISKGIDKHILSFII